MTALLLVLALHGQAAPIEAGLGLQVDVPYPVPDGWQAEPLQEPDSLWSLIAQENAVVTIVPLSLDTLLLPSMTALRDTSRISVAPPPVIVGRTMPDTSWNLALYPAPIPLDIPPGFPSDHLEQHMFWLDWGPAPGTNWLPVALPAAVLALLAAWILHRRRSRQRVPGGGEEPSTKTVLSPADEAMALLDTSAYASGDWPVFYREVDGLLRATLSARFGVSNPALTWRQVRNAVGKDREGRLFIEASSELTREIVLQRYAAWGGSRERARKYTGMLASLREEWHR